MKVLISLVLISVCFSLQKAFSKVSDGRYQCLISSIEIKEIAKGFIEVKDLMAGISFIAKEIGQSNYIRISGEDSFLVSYHWIADDKIAVTDKRDSIVLVYKLKEKFNFPYKLASESYSSSFVQNQVEQGFLDYYNANNEELIGRRLEAATLYARAITKLEVALNTGYQNAHISLLLGRCYYRGKGCNAQFAKSLIYYAKALRYAEAQFACAKMYDDGDKSLGQDWPRATMCYQLCTKQREDPYLKQMAFLELSEFYLLGVGGLEKSETKAKECLDSAQQQFELFKKRASAISASLQLLGNGQLNQANSYKNGGLDVQLGYDLLKPKCLKMGKEALLYRVTFAIPDNAEAVRILPVFYGKNDPETDYLSGFDYNPSPLYTSNGTHNLTIYMKEQQARFVGQLYIGLYVYTKASDQNAAYVLPVKVPVQAAWVLETD